MKHLGFIGPSGIGKTTSSTALAKYLGIERIAADEEIAKRLVEEGLILSVDKMGEWLGRPFVENYGELVPCGKFLAHCKKYLELEREVVDEVLDRVEVENSQPLIIDTSGSMVLLPEETRNRLREVCHIVYLQGGGNDNELADRYVADSKPVVSERSFSANPFISLDDNLRQWYLDELMYRWELYVEMAEGYVSLPFETHQAQVSVGDEGVGTLVTPKEFLGLIGVAV